MKLSREQSGCYETLFFARKTQEIMKKACANRQIFELVYFFAIACRPLDALMQRAVVSRCLFWQSTDTFSSGILDDVVFGKSGRLVHLVPFDD